MELGFKASNLDVYIYLYEIITTIVGIHNAFWIGIDESAKRNNPTSSLVNVWLMVYWNIPSFNQQELRVPMKLEYKFKKLQINCCYCCSAAPPCPTLCDPLDCSRLAFSDLHHLPELAQTQVHWVGDAIQPSHPLLSSFPPAFSLSQHQGLCIRWPKYWSFGFSISPSNEYSGFISFRIDWFDFLAKGLSRVFPNTAVQKHQFFNSQPSLWSIHDYWKNHSFD